MSYNQDLSAIFNRIANGEETERDMQTLRQLLRAREGQSLIQIGKYNVNTSEGRDIQIGDRIYQGADAEAIKEALRLVLQEKQKAQRPRNEKLLLQAVKDEVIARLKQSLHNAVLINLGKEAQPEQVKRPWSSDIKIGNKPSEPILNDRNIVEVFDQEEIAGKLLILGNPGAGKTTTMLDLAKALIARAEQDAHYPIGVLFNLSTWKDNKQSIRDWLVVELKSKYGVRKDIGVKWVDDAKLLPMLDGLDELESVRQEHCVRKINEFLQSDRRSQYLVVCSRQEEYEKVVRGQWQQEIRQDIRLHLNGAIFLKPLTDEQIQAYLVELNQVELSANLQFDTELLQLLRTPLFISIIGFISFQKIQQNLSFQNRETLNSSEAYLKYLLNAYYQACIERELVTPAMDLKEFQSLTYRKKNPPSKKQTRKWLVFLAQQLQKESQTEFLIEKIQSSYLHTNAQVYTYSLINGLIIGLISGLIIGFNDFNLGLVTGLFCVLYMTFELKTASFIQHFSKEKPGEIKIIENLKWSGKLAKRNLLISLIISPIAFLIIGLITRSYLLNKLFYWLIFVIILFLFSVPLAGIDSSDIEIKKIPNQGIWNTAVNAGKIGLITGLVIGGLTFILLNDIIDSLECLLVGILLGGLASGIFSCIKHFSIRLVLYFNGYIPWNYARFLNYCTERLFLQRVGGGYRFIHRLLQEHFAAMPLEK